jgi:hypothetical protein
MKPRLTSELGLKAYLAASQAQRPEVMNALKQLLDKNPDMAELANDLKAEESHSR